MLLRWQEVDADVGYFRHQLAARRLPFNYSQDDRKHELISPFIVLGVMASIVLTCYAAGDSQLDAHELALYKTRGIGGGYCSRVGCPAEFDHTQRRVYGRA